MMGLLFLCWETALHVKNLNFTFMGVFISKPIFYFSNFNLSFYTFDFILFYYYYFFWRGYILVCLYIIIQHQFFVLQILT